MRKLVMAIALLVVTSLPSMASAEGTGVYLAPKFLMSFQNTGNLSRSSALKGAGLDNYSQFTLGGALAAGYDLWPQHMLPVRIELELALRGNSKENWTGGNKEVKGTWNSTTLLANVYWDFHNESAFTPYVNAGLGMAFNYAGYDVAVGSTNFSMDEQRTNFAWNVGAGLAYSINESISVDAGYRFLDLGTTEASATIGQNRYKIETKPYNHELMLGVRFTF